MAGIRLPALGRSEAARRARHRTTLPWATAILVVSVIGAVVGVGLRIAGYDAQQASWAPIATSMLGVIGLTPLCVAATHGAEHVPNDPPTA